MGTLFEQVYRQEIFSPAACESMMRCNGRNFWDAEALSQIPPYIEVFSKNGTVDASGSEVLLVNSFYNSYVFCIFTKNIRDISRGDSNQAWVLTRKIARMLWNYFEQKDGRQTTVK